MEAPIETPLENPKIKANIFSKLFFCWMFGVFHTGIKRVITIKDLFKSLKTDESELLGNKLENNWKIEIAKALKEGRRPSLLKAVSKTFLFHYMLYGAFMVIHNGIKIFIPVVLSYLLQLFNGKLQVQDPQMEKYVSGTILVILMVVAILFYHHNNYGQKCIGMRVRIAVSTLIYRKILKLDQKSLGNATAGKVVNLLSNDVQRFDYAATALHHFWLSPLQVGVITYLLWREVALASLTGILSMLLITLPIQALLGRETSKYRQKVAIRTDLRVRLMNEVISGIKVIKMYAWEKPFGEIIKYARLDEVKMVKITNYIRGVFLSWTVFMERTTLAITLIVFVLMGNGLTSDVVFASQQYFNLLQQVLAGFLPLAIQMGAEVLVSIKRLEEFLLLEETSSQNLFKTTDKSITVDNVDAAWSEDSETLHKITIKVPPGKLCVITGSVGSGKSSILQLFLGELAISSGEVSLGGSASYSSQEPWLFAGTVKENILFGTEYDKNRYKEVLNVCALEKDLLSFPKGDSTNVGEKGVSLSGGQRARINLARAIYKRRDIYLLDDPLSAVDAHVGKHLFEECIIKYLGPNTRLLVTHQLQYLEYADHIIVLNNGKVEACGTIEDLRKSSVNYMDILQNTIEENDDILVNTKQRSTPKSSRRNGHELSKVASNHNDNDNEIEEKMYAGNEVTHAKSSAFRNYIKATGSVPILFLTSSVLLLSQIACSGADYWVTYWTRYEERKQRIPITNILTPSIMLEFIRNLNDSFTYTAIYIYSGLIVAIIVLAVLRSYLFFRSTSRASQTLHGGMLNTILKAPMIFFDTNPSGRVLNRFSKDTGAMDEILPRVLNESIQTILVMVGSITMIVIANYWIIIITITLVIIFAVLRKWFLSTAKSIKHVEARTKSPVFSTLNSTLNGLCTIRANNAEAILIKQFDGHQNVHTSAWFMLSSYMTAFGLWLDMIFVILFAGIVYIFIVISEDGDNNGAMFGLAITQAIGLTGMVQYGITQIAEVINQMTSVERILQYTNTTQEGPFETPKEHQLKLDWPSNGKIIFKDVSLRYKMGSEPILKKLNFSIEPGEKIGIVGRTGAGKSSLISALFRLAHLEGIITIDSIDTGLLGLHDLRSKISIIPQEPILFSASMRHNLDPFNEYSDGDLWNALEEVEMRNTISSLEYKVAEGGNNFSVGQRQLICLARAIIRKNKILILDEATANVDPRTDGLIQATIRRRFKHCTVLTIAHRLNTIMDSDRIIVMDAGSIVEYDRTYLLFQNPNGHFTKLLMEAGPNMFIPLRKIAEDAYNSRINT